MKIGVRNRKSVGPLDVAFAGLVAAYCICGNALATAYVEPLSADNLGPLALAYHDRPSTALPVATAPAAAPRVPGPAGGRVVER